MADFFVGGFEWDPVKDAANRRKHGVSFAEATEVFGDPLMMVLEDPDHSDGEQRFISLGRTRGGVVLFVSYTDRAASVRVISARLATKSEVQFYEQS